MGIIDNATEYQNQITENTIKLSKINTTIHLENDESMKKCCTIRRAAIRFSKKSGMMDDGSQNIWQIEAFQAGAEFQKVISANFAKCFIFCELLKLPAELLVKYGIDAEKISAKIDSI